MATSLRTNLTFLPSPNSSRTKPNPPITIRCGPRDNRNPLQRGRILSIESIQAIQALKRAKGDETKIKHLLSTTLTRLVKKDLLSTLNELLRQDQCLLALKVFSIVRSEFWYRTDCGLYADMVNAFARKGMMEEIDELMVGFEKEGLEDGEGVKISRLIKALTGVNRNEAVVRVFGVMKKGGWRCTAEVDEYVVKVLSRGLRRMGEEGVADEVEREFGDLIEGTLKKVGV